MNDTKFAVNDYNGYTVSCSKERWDTHILSGHKEMADSLNAVKDTIKNPDKVYESSYSYDCKVFFKNSEFSTKDALMRVVVHYYDSKKNPDNKVGEVTTAFYSKRENGGLGDVVYDATKN